jgi:hypothetical protein
MLCAVALSSSIKRIRMLNPHPCPNARDRGDPRRIRAAWKPARSREADPADSTRRLNVFG